MAKTTRQRVSRAPKTRAKQKSSEKVLKKPQADAKGQYTFLAPVKIPWVKPGMPRHVAVINEIRARATEIGGHFIVVLRLCDELVAKRYYEKAGFQTPQDLFDQKIPHLSWSTVRRYLGILEAVRRLPEGQRERAMEALQGIGVTKAAIVARIIGKEGQGWSAWVDRAKRMGEEELAQAVAAALDRQLQVPGTEPRPPMRQGADVKWLKYTLHSIEPWAPDAAKEIEECFEAGKRALSAESYWSVLLAMTQECVQEWRMKAQAAQPAAAPEGEASS
jgi:hypothetical protein